MPNPMFKTPKIEVALADSRKREYSIAAGSEGFFFYDRLASLAQAGKLYTSAFPANTMTQFGAQAIPHLIPINRQHLKGILPTPYYRQPVPAIRGDDTPTRRWGVTTSTGAPDWPTPAGTIHNDFWNYYTFSPTGATYDDFTAYWDFTLRPDGLLYDMTQKVAYEGDSSVPQNWIRSEVGFSGPELADGHMGQAPNPFFTVGFRRQACSPYMQSVAAAAYILGNELPGTTISWGGLHIDTTLHTISYPYGKWMLWCPVVGKPQLYEWVGADWVWAFDPNPAGHFVPRAWTEGDLEEYKAEKAADEGYTYHIGTMGHAICVSQSGYLNDQNFAYYLVEGADEPVCPSGQVLVSNFPGQFTCWLDLNVFPVATARSWPKYAPSLDVATVQGRVLGQPFSWAARASEDEAPVIVDTLPDTEGMSVSLVGPVATDDDGLTDHMRYDLRISEGVYPTGAAIYDDVLTQTPPFVEAVQIWQEPVLTDNGAPAFTVPARPVADIGIDGEAEGNQRVGFTVSNLGPIGAPGDWVDPATAPLADWNVGRAVKLNHVGWIYEDLDGGADTDVTATWAEMWIAAVEAGFLEGRISLIDALGWLALAQWEGESDLCFRSWSVYDALRFGLEMNGFGARQYDLEDILDIPESDQLVHGRGKSWLEVMRSLAGGDSRSDQGDPWGGYGGVLYYDLSDGKVKTACRYCRTKRTEAVVGTDGNGNDVLEWMTHSDNGWDSSGCLAADALRITGGVDLVAYLTPDVTWNGFNDPLEAAPFWPYSVQPAWDFRCEVAALDRQDYANSITVVGTSARRDKKYSLRGRWWRDARIAAEWSDDRQILGHWRNADALDYTEPPGDDFVGFTVSRVENDDALMTQQDVNQRVAQLAARSGVRAKKIRFVTPMAVAVKVGMVAQVQGAAWAGCDGLKFRLVGVRHDPSRGTTQFEGREMVGPWSVPES